MVRSFAEAQTIAARLKNFGAPQLAGLEPEIDETTIGNMGTFYRVRIGPFANADDPRLLCVKLRGSGFDCLVTPQ
jgi:cell division septation protein DedD